MKAAVYYSNGGPEVFRYVDVEDPLCGDADILIRVEAACIERLDIVSREVRPLPRVPHVVGCVCSGVVVRIGSKVTERAVGQKVVAVMWWGSHAELAVIAPRYTWVVPEGMPLRLASTIPVQFGIAHDTLVEFGRLRNGETVLIHDAASGRGLAAIQLAKKIGARVVATAASTVQARKLQSSQADVVVDLIKEDFVDAALKATGGRGVDLVMETTGGELLRGSVEAMSYRGRLVTAGSTNGRADVADPQALWVGNKALQGVSFPNTVDNELGRIWPVIDGYLREAAAGDFKVEIDSEFPLPRVREAHARAASWHAYGSVLLVANSDQ